MDRRRIVDGSMAGVPVPRIPPGVAPFRVRRDLIDAYGRKLRVPRHRTHRKRDLTRSGPEALRIFLKSRGEPTYRVLYFSGME